MARLLKQVWQVLAEVDTIAQVAVVSRDTAVRQMAQEAGFWAIPEAEPDLNTAVTQAVAFATAHGASHALILPADLPCLTVQDVQTFLTPLQTNPQTFLICPDTREEGSNALLLPLPTTFVFGYGVGSFQRHWAQATAVGLIPQRIATPGLQFDLDTPADWQAYLQTTPPQPQHFIQ